MKVYVQSCGYSPDDDYCWQSEIPEIIKRNQVNQLIQSEFPSIVLARYPDHLLLLLTGLEAKERKDFRGRKIRNSVAFVCKKSERNEQILRSMTVMALRGSLKDKIDAAIKSGGEHGFEFSPEDLIRLSSIEVESLPVNSDSNSKIGKNSEDLRAELADELEQYCLPQETDFNNPALVVVTGIKSESAFKEAGVWRGLSNLIQNEDWKDLDEQISFLESDVDHVAHNEELEQNDKKTILLVLSELILTDKNLIILLMLLEIILVAILIVITIPLIFC